MQILIKNIKQQEKETALFLEFFRPYVSKFSMGVKKIPELCDNFVFKYNTAAMNWPIRKLEYSYVINKALERKGQKGRILDVGSGVTPFAFCLKEIIGGDAFAVDCDEELIRLMKKYQTEIFNDQVGYISGDMMNLPFNNDNFDFISCISVIEHLNKDLDMGAIRELLRVLKKGGSLILTIDYTAGYQKISSKFIYRLKKFIEYLGKREFEFILKRSIRIAKSNTPVILHVGPYTREKVEGEFIDIFGKNLHYPHSKLDEISLEDIRKFWSSNWFIGCNYSKNGQDYVSIAIELTK